MVQVGIACCQIALAHGLQVLATAGTERGLQMLHQNNVTSTFNHNEKGYVKKIQASFCLDHKHTRRFNHADHHVLLRKEKGRRWRKRSKGKVHSMGDNWCRDFEVRCPSCCQPVLKTSTPLELILSSTTNRLLREGTSLPFTSALRPGYTHSEYNHFKIFRLMLVSHFPLEGFGSTFL